MFPTNFPIFSISSMFSDLENKSDKAQKKKKLGNKVFLGVLRILSFSEQTFQPEFIDIQGNKPNTNMIDVEFYGNIFLLALILLFIITL